MKKYLVILALVISFYGCSDDGGIENNILPNIPVNETLFLNNPQYIDLQVVGGWAYANGGISGLVIYHASSNLYLAFERSAPHLKPSVCSKMTVKNSIVMHCDCDDTEFSLLDGSPMTDGIKYPARQYRTTLLGNNTLQISNF